MVDRLTTEQRSKNMSRIRGQNTGPEILLRKKLWLDGVRYRVRNTLPGRPDIVIHRFKTAIFVDGCFWHGCPEHGHIPKSNREYWEGKLRKNMGRDEKNTKLLESQGWKVLRIWEHEIKDNLESVSERVRQSLLACLSAGTHQ